MKKGFTLVELLAVIIIMIMLFSIVTVNLTNIIKKASNKEYSNLSSVIENAAKMYISSENPSELETVGGTYCVTLEMLNEKGLIETPIIDPRNDQEFDNITCVLVTKLSISEYNYEFNPDYDNATITLLGNAVDTVSCLRNTNYSDMGASVYDPFNLDAGVIYSPTTLSLEKTGTHYLKYNYTNDYGDATASRKVIIKNDNQPVIEIENNITSIDLDLYDTVNPPEAIATDLCDYDIDVIISSNVDTTTNGTYYITYTATNSGGVTAKRLIRVTVGTGI